MPIRLEASNRDWKDLLKSNPVTREIMSEGAGIIAIQDLEFAVPKASSSLAKEPSCRLAPRESGSFIPLGVEPIETVTVHLDLGEATVSKAAAPSGSYRSGVVKV